MDGLAEQHPEFGGALMRFEYLRELWGQRELLYFLALRDIQVRYKQAALGILWAIIQPLFTMIVFSVLFGRVARFSSDDMPYPVFSFSALLLWMYFSATLSLAGNSLVGNANLITKVYFPRVLMPAASALAGLLDVGIGALFLIGLMIYHGIVPGWGAFLAPLSVAHLFLLTLGLSMFLAAMNVRYRDVKYVIPFLTQIWLFVTPIIYPVTFIPERYQGLLALNPVTGIIEGFRASLLATKSIPWDLIGTSWAVTIVILLVGAIYFRKTEREFADVV